MGFVSDASQTITITVVSAAKGQLGQITAPNQVVQGEAFSISAPITNSGGVDAEFLLHIERPAQGSLTTPISRNSLSQTLAPGATVTFTADVVPALSASFFPSPGTYTVKIEAWRNQV